MFASVEPGHYLLYYWGTYFSSSWCVVLLDQKPSQEETVSLDCIFIVPVMCLFASLLGGQDHFFLEGRHWKGNKPALVRGITRFTE